MKSLTVTLVTSFTMDSNQKWINSTSRSTSNDHLANLSLASQAKHNQIVVIFFPKSALQATDCYKKQDTIVEKQQSLQDEGRMQNFCAGRLQGM